MWVYLCLFWVGVQLYLYPVLVGMQAPSVSGALRMAAAMAFASPLFSILLLVIAAVLTGIGVALAVTLFAAWPAVIILLGEHAVKLVAEQAARKSS